MLPDHSRLAELLSLAVSALRDSEGRITGLRLPVEAYDPLADAVLDIASSHTWSDAVEAASQPRRMKPVTVQANHEARIRAAGSIA